MICEVIVALRHGSNKHANALVVVQTLDIVSNPHHFRIKAQCNFSAVRREVVGDWVFNDVDQFLLGGCRANLVSVEKLDH